MHARLAALALAVSPLAAQADFIQWTNASGDRQFGNPANWDAGRVPGTADTAYIGPNYGWVDIRGAHSVGWLFTYTPTYLYDSLRVHNAATLDTNFYQVGAQSQFYIDYATQINIYREYHLQAGGMTSTYSTSEGAFNIKPSGTLYIEGSSGKSVSGSLAVEGRVEYTGSGFYLWSTIPAQQTVVGIAPGAVFNITGGGSIATNLRDMNFFMNNGTVRVANYTAFFMDDVYFYNAGRLFLDGANAYIGYPAQIGGGTTLARGTWEIRSAQLSLRSGYWLTGLGDQANVILDGATAQWPALGPVGSNAGQFTLRNNAVLTVQGPDNHFRNTGTVTVGRGAQLRVISFFDQVAGTLICEAAGAAPSQHGRIMPYGYGYINNGNAVLSAVDGWTPAFGDRVPFIEVDPNSLFGLGGQFTSVYGSGYLSADYAPRTMSFVVTCGVDFNGDGFVDFFDYDDFVRCFESYDCPTNPTPRSPDFNGDGFADFFDYDAFVGAFEQGC